MESAYADPQLLRDLGMRGARFTPDIGVEVIVGAETAGVPLAASISLTAEMPFAFVRKPGYRGHEIATASGLLDPALHKLTVDAIVNRWTDDDARWDLLPVTGDGSLTVPLREACPFVGASPLVDTETSPR
jgi:hypothetical protein